MKNILFFKYLIQILFLFTFVCIDDVKSKNSDLYLKKCIFKSYFPKTIIIFPMCIHFSLKFIDFSAPWWRRNKSKRRNSYIFILVVLLSIEKNIFRHNWRQIFFSIFVYGTKHCAVHRFEVCQNLSSAPQRSQPTAACLHFAVIGVYVHMFT